jgi:hypothetical protein
MAVRNVPDTTKPSATVKASLYLIYYFSICDFVLKFFPPGIAVALRYLPEVALYSLVLVLLLKQWRIVAFPLFWPLCLCALTMTISVLLNSGSVFAALADYRLFFRFTAFTYIAWRTTKTPERITQFIRGFLGLTVIELVLGGLELVGGSRTQIFFSPAGENSINQVYGQAGFIFGTMSDYNQYGMFMTMSCVLSLALYSIQGLRRYLWLASACALSVVLSFSRHSLLMLPLALTCFFLLRRNTVTVSHLVRVGVVVLASIVALTAFVELVDPEFGKRLFTINANLLESDRPENMRLLMTVNLTPRFLAAYPLFGQGPIALSDAVQSGDTDTSHGPPLKAAPDFPPELTFYLGDVVWVMILGLYGCCGLAAFGFVLWKVAATANRVRKNESNPEYAALARACLAIIVAFVVSGFFSEEMIARDTIPVFWTVAGLVLMAHSEDRMRGRDKRDLIC